MTRQTFDYEGTPITFSNGESVMVNATQMAKPFGKTTKDWLRTGPAKDFIDTLSVVRHICLTELVQVRQGGQPELQGTWMHEDVALEFARWLSPKFAIWCNDRIKELMRHGMTATPQTLDAMLNDPDTMIRTLQALKSERERADMESRRADMERVRADALEQRVLIETPFVEYATNVLNSEGTFTTLQIAKELGMSAQRLNRILSASGVQYRKCGQWLLYAKYQNKGYMKTRTHAYERSNGRIGTMHTSAWTEAGRMFIHRFVKNMLLDI